MHYLIVAKVKDYLVIGDLIFGLTRHTDILNPNDLNGGKWENITDEFQDYCKNSYLYPKMALVLFYEIFADYGKDVPYKGDKYTPEELLQKKRQFIKDHGFWIDDGNVYAKVSGNFDYIAPGGKYDMETEEQKAKYKDVVAKFGKVDVFVLPDFECRFTKHRDVECPYQDDDEVWVLDGYTYCEW